MPTDKETKKEFKKTASKNPDKFYATSVLKEEGFFRKQCSCGTFFWTTDRERKVCGDPACAGGFGFFGKSPAKKKLDYIGVWKEFSKMFKKLGYTPIERYPVVARWRDDTDFVQASIYDFQPYVVSGEVNPPAKKLVVPQFCLRFNDIDNVGITGAHYTGFVMIGQHAFVTEKEWNQKQYFKDIHTWLTKGLGLPNKEITFHEDAWAGGGNFGPCMEYFSRGLELGNQVYMMYEQTPKGPKPLKLRVLDMGMGHERNAWFTQGKSTSYETTFPTVCKKLFSATGINKGKTARENEKIISRFLPYSSYLNVDEVEDIDKTWDFVAKQAGIEKQKLKDTVIPLSALFSVAEHSRALLFAISDGALPSNVAGGYNLRVILRRALSFIDKYNWNISLPEICEWHAQYLKPLFPEVSQNLEEVKKILEVEKIKYENTKQKTSQILQAITAKKEKIGNEKLLELYDSCGISPEIVSEEARKVGLKVEVPENFYANVAELHSKKEQEHATVKSEKLCLDLVSDTKAEYFDDWQKQKFSAKVLKIIGNKVVTDKTLFYPTSGGQIHDTGSLGGHAVLDVFKQGSVIVHVLDANSQNIKFREGAIVEGIVDLERRKQLAQHHTATHIIGAAARKILGNHINQAGAKKGIDKAHIDLTHYESITEDELRKIEEEANRIVQKGIETRLSFLPRDEAEKKFGTVIYQGGAVPGKMLRIVEIPGIDVECCGGTHLHNTKEVSKIKILGSSKVQDGVVRITFTAGKAAMQEEKGEREILEKTAGLLGCAVSQLPARAEELFSKWKDAVKKGKKVDKALVSAVRFAGSDKEILVELTKIYKTQPEYIAKTTERFLKELKEA